MLIIMISQSLVSTLTAQSPNKMSYQSVIRNTAGGLVVNQSIGIKLSILQGIPTGTVVYAETFTLSTNANGLVSLEIGTGTIIVGTIAAIVWTNGPYFLKTEIDPTGGVSYTITSVTEFLSVPYSFYAATAGTTSGTAGGDLYGAYPNPTVVGIQSKPVSITSPTVNQVLIWDGVNWTPGANVTGAASGDLSGTYPNPTVVKLQTLPVSATAPATNDALVWNGVAWAPIANVSGAAGGDLLGSYPNPTVAGIQTRSVSATPPLVNDALVWNGAQWAPSGNVSGAAGGDLGGTYPNPSVVKLQTRPVSAGVPATNDALVWNGSSWTPTASTGLGTNYWTLNGSNQIYNNNAGGLVGIGTSTPANKLEVLQTGATAAGLFTNTNAANNASTVSITTNSTNATALSVSGPGIWGSAIGITNTVSGMEWRTSVIGTSYSVTKIPGSTFTPFTLLSDGQVEFGSTAGATRLHILDNGNVGIGTAAPTQRLHVAGTVRIQDGTEGLGKIFRSTDALGNGAWATLAAAGVVAGSGTLNYIPKWTPNGLTLGNSLLFDDGTNVGIGTSTPVYKLDVLHAGATGIRSQSSASFSVVDIDGFTGDAALRFYKAGVGQWNTRNRPADNYYEIFELGGGGSRMVIQDATGWVGIGGSGAPGTAVFSPAYALDVEHAGATGIRSRSDASFSVVDIDAFSGDAALRFQRAGVGQWNVRNRPLAPSGSTNDFEIFELGGGGSRMVIQDATGWIGIGGLAAVGTPTDAPAYALDLLHGGATGFRSKSSASFSVVDIDANSGDAALRFQKAGVGQWNTRNEPVNNDYQWFELGGGGERMRIQRGSGNVGINQPAPAYKLDVNHGGATGIRVQSSASFSVVDIDANSGDAALRFIRNGVSKWNTRNEPVNDDYQWFELGGGGERMRIQRGSGNVGINQPLPAYKLDILHGGATGVHVASSASFSVVDIDAINGDAALRFVRAGVNKWNTRNEPTFDDYQIFELGGGGERIRIKRGTGFVGINTSAPSTQLEVVGTITGTVKAFTIDHPLDPANKTLRHISMESPEALDVYSGNIVTDAAGKAVVDLPSYFEALNKDFRYQLTVIGAFAQAIISKEIVNNKFEIATNQPNIKVSWQVQGVRNDPYMKNVFDLKMEEDKPASIKGKYYHPEAYGLPQSMGVTSIDTKGTSTENIKVSPAKTAQPEVINGSSLELIKIAPSTNKIVDKSGSVEDIKVLSKVKYNPVDNSGSVSNAAPVAQPKAAVKSDGNSSIDK